MSGKLLTPTVVRSTIGTVPRSPRALIWLVFVIGFAIAVAFAVFGALWADELDLWAELGKAGIQLAVVVIGGAVLTTALRALETERENRRRRRDALRRSLLEELSTAYAGLKDVRRTLRASGFGSPAGVLTAEQVEEFTAQMKALVELQLSLERCVGNIRAEPDLLANGGPLVRLISQVEAYVRELIREWDPSSAVGGRMRAVFGA